MSTNTDAKTKAQNNKPNLNKPNPNDAIAKLALVSAFGAGVAWLANRYLDTVEADLIRQRQAMDAKQTSHKPDTSLGQTASASSLKDSMSDGLSDILNKTLHASKASVQATEPQPLRGTVIHTFEEFSFTTQSGASYHVFDPQEVLAKIAKDRGVYDAYYTLNRVHVSGVVSKVGNYGHLGKFERQLTIVRPTS